jgi:hypothetical protein
MKEIETERSPGSVDQGQVECKLSAGPGGMKWEEGKEPKIAVLLHLFHDDVLSEMARYVRNVRLVFPGAVAVVTVRENLEADRREQIQKALATEHLLPVENRGVDISAFLLSVRYLRSRAMYPDFILKIHSKKSCNRWRKKLIEPLVSAQNLLLLSKIFEEDLRIQRRYRGECPVSSLPLQSQTPTQKLSKLPANCNLLASKDSSHALQPICSLLSDDSCVDDTVRPGETGGEELALSCQRGSETPTPDREAAVAESEQPWQRTNRNGIVAVSEKKQANGQGGNRIGGGPRFPSGFQNPELESMLFGFAGAQSYVYHRRHDDVGFPQNVTGVNRLNEGHKTVNRHWKYFVAGTMFWISGYAVDTKLTEEVIDEVLPRMRPIKPPSNLYDRTIIEEYVMERVLSGSFCADMKNVGLLW